MTSTPPTPPTPHTRHPTRDRGERRGWSDSQRTTFLRACSAAGWNDQQRYMAMRHCGCPLQGDRPSVKSPRNTNGHFEQLMALAEAQAKLRGRDVRPPREHRSWREAAENGRLRLVELARSIIAEGVIRVPDVFNDGLERYIIAHTTADDLGNMAGIPNPLSLDECDGGQLHRVVEALRAYVGRELDARGLQPRNFVLPPSVIRRRSPAA
jgi:hypothetical protein